MRTQKVIVTAYDPHWAENFLKIREMLMQALGSCALAIEHVGSTSVPGLAAKPILDIDVVIEGPEKLEEAIRRLAAVGYWHEGDLGIPGREAFGYDERPGQPLHHLYVCFRDSRELHRHLVFRDYLRSHPEAAAEYGRVKLEAARLYPADIDGYMARKSPCIQKLYRACGLEAGEE